MCMLQGNPVGQSGLGLMYMSGKGVSQVSLVIPFMLLVYIVVL